MRALAAALAAIALVAGHSPARAAAQPGLRTLFVGIDHYSHSYPADPDANPDFHDLQGAVADVRLIKATLAETYHVALDPDPSGRSCDSRNAISITLTDLCATRDAILGALDHQIADAAPGDIVLFYYAGHGSTHPALDATQVHGENSTIVPSDARRPPLTSHNDILDVELKLRIDQAKAHGVSVVTIFDSCHSGTATRDLAQGLSRAAPAAVGGPPPEIQTPAPLPGRAIPAGAPPPYQVHLAAASDQEEAYETKGDAPRHGVFTLALTDAIAQLRGATYLDIAQEVRWRLEQQGEARQVTLRTGLDPTPQHSQAEGALTARFLGQEPDPARTYTARPAGASALRLDGGSLTGVTQGSSFAVYASASAAADAPQSPLANGVIGKVEPAAATLNLAAPPPPTAARTLFVREVSHNYGAQGLKVRVDGGGSGDRARITKALNALGGPDAYVRVVKADPQFIVRIADGRAEYRDAKAQARVISSRALNDPDFDGWLGEVTRATANYFALLGLRNDNGRAWGCVTIVPRDQPVEDCPAGSPPATVKLGDVDMWLATAATEHPLYRYALFLNSQTYEISVIDPPGYSNDEPMPANSSLLFFHGRFQRPGRGVVLVLLTQDPINVATLRQSPLRDIAVSPRNDLERLLVRASFGQRGDTEVRSGAWGALAIDVSVTP